MFPILSPPPTCHCRCQTNSFQCVLASNGDKSVTLFLYDSIQWVVADARPLPMLSKSGSGSGSGSGISVENNGGCGE